MTFRAIVAFSMSDQPKYVLIPLKKPDVYQVHRGRDPSQVFIALLRQFRQEPRLIAYTGGKYRSPQ